MNGSEAQNSSTTTRVVGRIQLASLLCGLCDVRVKSCRSSAEALIVLRGRTTQLLEVGPQKMLANAWALHSRRTRSSRWQQSFTEGRPQG